MFESPHIIDAYSREQAIRDNVLHLVDPALARDAGFRWPITLTNALHNALCLEDNAATGQSYAGRLWDVLSTGRIAIKLSSTDGSTLRYKTRILHHEDKYQTLRRHAQGYKGCQPPEVLFQHYRMHTMVLRLACGPSDTGAPCFTIGFDQGDDW